MGKLADSIVSKTLPIRDEVKYFLYIQEDEKYRALSIILDIPDSYGRRVVTVLRFRRVGGWREIEGYSKSSPPSSKQRSILDFLSLA